ncbi:hypothetical protein [Inhella sp.]|uniref:hypothetical protein n=1 Tax=Inhella sp. TaxID=1921806 RepID=UPI0035B14E87
MKRSRALALLAGAVFSLNAMAWTVSFSGTIDQGFDNSGVFGVAGRDLRGLSFTQTIEIATDPALWSVSNGGPVFTDISGHGPAFVDTVTVDGQTVRFEVEATGYGRQFLFDEFSTQHTGADYLYTDQRGLAQGDTLRAFQYAYSYLQAFMPSLDFDQGLDLPASGLTTWSEFVITGQRHANFYGNASSIRVNGGPGQEVPEPTPLALAGFGLLLLGGHARRRGRGVQQGA